MLQGLGCRWGRSVCPWAPTPSAPLRARCQRILPMTAIFLPNFLPSRRRPTVELVEWLTTGRGLPSSSLYDAVAFFSTGLGDEHTHDGQLGFMPTGFNADLYRRCLRLDPDEMFEDPEVVLDLRPSRLCCWSTR